MSTPATTTPVVPYGQDAGTKKEQVTQMFDAISHRYDLLNHLLSMGIDRIWRSKSVKLLAPLKPQQILDVATGTGDFAIAAAKLKPQRIVGLDISPGMLTVGRQKIEKKKLGPLITMMQGDSEHLPFEDNSFDAITVGFGVRNFENLERGLSELLRVLRPGGLLVVLEPAAPTKFPLKQMFQFYFRYILPVIGKMISKDDRAYTYLPESVAAFPNGSDFLEICSRVGFRNGVYTPLTFGICSQYRLEK